MPDREVKTIRDLIFYQYAKIIAKSSLGPDAKKKKFVREKTLSLKLFCHQNVYKMIALFLPEGYTVINIPATPLNFRVKAHFGLVFLFTLAFNSIPAALLPKGMRNPAGFFVLGGCCGTL